TQRGTLGQVTLVSDGRFDRYLVSQSQMKLTVNRDIADPLFFYYLFTSAEQQEYIRQHAIQTGVPHTNLGILRATPVPLPPINEQHAIAHILGTLDDKIELNRRMSETLETMARALFKSWFVDFDPIRAKMEGRDPGLAKPIADLFPARLVDSEFGEIPEGWRLVPLGDLTELRRGKTYKSGLKDLPGPVLLGLGSIERNGGFRDDKLSTYGGDSPANLILGPGDIFASLKDVTQSADLLGAVARVPDHIREGRLTQDTVKLMFKAPSVSRELVYQSLLTAEYRDYCRAHATGTTNLGLSRDDFLAYPIVQPSPVVAAIFDRFMRSFEESVANSASRSRTLAALRDALLPKLISGVLGVGDIAQSLEGVAQAVVAEP
ncbi:MAG TPA: restriction endonuclease subunit S, partial [Casimicrobiaceae bacterium]|nr:restriction endonuclease subunit S [Casimicrobiaceae bacterium]